MREARLASGLTQKEAAEALGVTAAALCHVELGNKLPGRDLAVRIEELFGVEVSAWTEAA